ncbi:PBN1 [Candida jiufengensis]|uniref:PBN1 n=1 Tax=Candida jiufengensis TaxID=497108 RepID=UPI0022243424|nr:PBN1 [Candida jiufengensis]KAI5956813.1 PBN1 [Candida jiufengensis]
MIKQRSTIINYALNHDDVIKHLNQTTLILKSASSDKPLLVENKFTIPFNKKLQHINQLRIQSKFNEESNNLNESINEFFPFEFTSGINIYVEPRNKINNDDNVEFFKELKEITHEFIGLEIGEEQWVNHVDSLYYYDLSPSILRLESPGGNKEYWYDNKTFDLIYKNNVKENQITLRQIFTSNELDYNLKLTEYKEIGIFLKDSKVSTSKDDLVLSGLRVILDGQSETTKDGEESDKNMYKTMFHFKPRHRYLTEGEYKTNLINNGLHPIFNTQISLPELEEDEEKKSFIIDDDVINCNSFIYLNLNKSLIFDKYQNVPINTTLLISSGFQDLELPEYKIDQWGRELLFKLDDDFKNQKDFNLTLHSRYQLPQNNNTLQNSYTNIINSKPKYFIACKIKDSEMLSKSPFDTTRHSSIGNNYENYFAKDTVFYHPRELNAEKNLQVSIPHGITTFNRINSITTITLIIGILIILTSVVKYLFKSFTSTTEHKTKIVKVE